MSRSFTDNNVTFNNISASTNTGGTKISSGDYIYDEEGNIIENNPVINSIDIDWNSAVVPGLENPINSTGQLLNIVGTIYSDLEESQSNLNNLSESQSELSTLVTENNATYTDLFNEIKQQIQQIIDGQTQIGGSGNHELLTLAEYEALIEKDPDTIYFIVDDDSEEGEEEFVEPVSTQLYVNGVLHTESNVVLQPGQVYTLEGDVVGTLIIDTTSVENTNTLENTELRLHNVRIISSEDFGIKYLTPVENKGYKDLVITLEKNTKNYIVCTQTTGAGEDEPGAVYSMNNLTIQGAGYLAVHNTAGHGIRATEVKLLAPHIYADVSHDAIHGKKIWICGGTYYVENANDAFGTGIGGTIKYAYGKLYARTLRGKTFNAKSGLDENEVQKTGALINIEDFDIESLGTYSRTESVNIADYYTTGNVKEYTSANGAKLMTGGTAVEETTEMYIISQQFVVVSGKITKPINIPSTLTDVTIYLNDAAIITNCITVNENQVNEPCISYDSSKSNVKIFGFNDTYNVIINNCPEVQNGYDCDAIKSEHNIKFEIKNDSYIYVTSKSGDGIDGTDVEITDSKGVLMIHNCGERAIKGTTIIIGPAGNTLGTDITLITTPTDPEYKTFDGVVIAYGNSLIYGNKEIELSSNKIAVGTGYADIFARKGKAIDKGTFITSANELKGLLICGSIGATIAINMDNSANIYYNNLVILDNVTLSNISNATDETYVAYPYKNSPISA